MPQNDETSGIDFTRYFILSRNGGVPTITGFVINNRFLTAVKVALVAVAVSARTFTCGSIMLFISPS